MEQKTKEEKLKNKSKIGKFIGLIFELPDLGKQIENIHLKRIITGILSIISLAIIISVMLVLPSFLVIYLWKINKILTTTILTLIVLYIFGSIFLLDKKNNNRKEVNKNGRKQNKR